MLSPSGYNDPELEDMWNELEDVPFDETEDGRLILAEDWRQFPKGTEREEIWKFFDKEHSMGVHWLLTREGDYDIL